MATDTVHLNWNPEEEFTLSDSDDYQIVMKKPKGVKASNLLAMALIGCSSHDVVEILNKQKQNLQELRVTAESMQDDDPPWRFRRIHIHYQAVGTGIDPEKVGKAIRISEEKYCSVHATLKDAVEITHDYEVVEA
jgi:putative redox protein